MNTGRTGNVSLHAQRLCAAGVLVLSLTVSACSLATASSKPSVFASESTVPSGSAASSGPTTPAGAASPVTPSTAAPGSRDLALYGLPQLDDLMHGAAIASLSGGPAGIVVLGNDRQTGALISWTSADGDDWVRHWLPGSTFGGGTPERVVGGSFGYLALGWSVEPVSRARSIWSSADGVTWRQDVASDLPDGEVISFVSGPAGAIASFDLGSRGAAVATSQDGRVWHEAVLSTVTVANVQAAVALPDGFLVVGSTVSIDASGAETATDAAWRSSDGIAWTLDSAIADQILHRDNSIESWQLSPLGTAGSGLGNADVGVVTASGFEPLAAPPDTWGQLVGGPIGLLWVQGADRLASCSAAWNLVDDAWRPLTGTNIDRGCLDAAAPFVLGSASVTDATVVIAQLSTSADRTAWLVRSPAAPPTAAADNSSATPPRASIPDPLAAAIERPVTCPSRPTTIEAVLDVAARIAVGCFGDQSLSFTAWVVDPGEGYGGTCAAFEPAWIRECVLPDYLFAARRPGNADGEQQLHAMRAPSATGATKGVGRWVRVHGHYDDAVSPSCRAAGDVGSVGLESETPPALAVLDCRQVFVVTDIRTVQ